MATCTLTTSTPREAEGIPTPAELLALVERLAQEFLVDQGIDPGDLTALHPTWTAIGAELERALPHRTVETDFALQRFFLGLWYVGMEQERGDDAQHAVAGIADAYFERRAMTRPARNVGEFCARLAHAKRAVLDGGFYTDPAAMIGFLDTIGADFMHLQHGAGR